MFRRRVRITLMSHLFSFPWRGPRNSEGPVDPEGWWNPPGDHRLVRGSTAGLLTTSPWPGPGNSEG
jgi:hypothetical protein